MMWGQGPSFKFEGPAFLAAKAATKALVWCGNRARSSTHAQMYMALDLGPRLHIQIWRAIGLWLGVLPPQSQQETCMLAGFNSRGT